MEKYDKIILMKKSVRGKIILLLLLAGVFFAFNIFGVSSKIKNSFYGLTSLIQGSLWDQGNNFFGVFEGFTKAKKLSEDAENLRLENQKLVSELSLLKEVQKENEFLKKAMDLGLEKEFKLTLVKPLGKDVTQDYILINKGSKEGISKDMPVITEEKVLVGKIGEVYDNFSKVILLTSKDSSIDAKIPGTEIYGLIKGRGNFNAVFDLVPKDNEIKSGDQVITSSLGGIFPEGILIGQLEEVEKLDVKPYQAAKLNPAFDIKYINNFLVIINFKK